MMTVSFILAASMCAADEALVRVVDTWVIEVGPGMVSAGDHSSALLKPVRLEVPQLAPVHVADEEHAGLPDFDPKAAGWRRGARLARLVTEECSATGLLHPETLRVKLARGETQTPLVAGKDYCADGFWATFGRNEGGAIPKDATIYADYDYTPSRLDDIVVTEAGEVRLNLGMPQVGALLPGTPGAGETVIGRVFLYGPQTSLSEENLFPVDFALPPHTVTPDAERLLPKTLAKLRAGQPVTIVAWGDSVTAGSGLQDKNAWYQYRFATLLQERFRASKIEMLTASWPGAGSDLYLKAAPGSPHEFARDVLEPKPDLVTIEFVNDAYLDVPGVQEHYGKIIDILSKAGAEVILIAPHLVRPDWMQATTLKFDNDPRPYVAGLRQFAKARGIALADAAKDWCQLHRQGIPYTTLLLNSINHPDARGHEIFAQALIGLFPKS